MRSIQMVDTQTQYQKIKSEINLAIQEVLDSSAYINGKIVQEFAVNLARYLDVKHVIPCANGTDALQIAMMALHSLSSPAPFTSSPNAAFHTSRFAD